MKLRFSFLALCIFVSVSFGSDNVSLNITRAELSCPGNADNSQTKVLRFAFDQSLNADELLPCDGTDDCPQTQAKLRKWINETLQNTSNYYLVELKTGRVIRLSAFPEIDYALGNTLGFGIISEPNELDVNDLALVARTVGYGTASPSLTKVVPAPSCEQIAKTLPKPAQLAELDAEKENKTFASYFKEPAKGEDGILKVDFALSGAKHEQLIYYFNVKFNPYTTRRLGFGGHYELNYFVVDTEYRINARKGDKKNVLNVGALDFRYTKVLRDDGDEKRRSLSRVIPGVTFSLKPRLETEWRFDEMKFVVGPAVTLPLNLFQARWATVQLNPFAGIDVGKTLRSQVSKKKLVLRPFFGAGLTANFFRRNDKPSISAQIDYIRRVFIRPEAVYGFNANNEEIFVSESRLPRDHVKARIDLHASELFSPFVEYEYGWVPPKYTLLNSSFRTGIAFNIDMVWKSFK